MLDAEYQRFTTAVDFWLCKIGLTDWEVLVESRHLGSKHKTVRACVHLNWQQRHAVVQWNTGYKSDKMIGAETSPEEVAKHEVLHILLNACLNLAALHQSVDAPDVDAEEHAVIKRLMKLL